MTATASATDQLESFNPATGARLGAVTGTAPNRAPVAGLKDSSWSVAEAVAVMPPSVPPSHGSGAHRTATPPAPRSPRHRRSPAWARWAVELDIRGGLAAAGDTAPAGA